MADNHSDSNNNFNGILPLRESLINTAVKFLRNPQVSSSSSNKKYIFLKNKGLTDEEIKKSFELAAAALPVDNKNEFTAISIPSYNNNNNNYVSSNYLIQQPKWIYIIKEFFNVTAFIGTTFYCIYWCYKKFIEPFLFKRKPPSKPDDSNEIILKDVKEMKESIANVEENVNKLTCNHTPDPTVPQLIQELKQDLASLKGLLLSRKQFPSAPPSIPTWQLDDASNQNREKTTEDDAASGSSANNSDSSLEMIREDPK
ncbi:peroxisomal membrane protein PEX14 [Microplitis mediator]|uniref:peroxisomal membrane protein PEX14 n=1 Tax=Microplitis mediator TaxID=375433 RepID=UPI0025532EA7|nr:peroxisomal membrane protein PEX14 [Microplitis mediator]